jgi:hypothetical protein
MIPVILSFKNKFMGEARTRLPAAEIRRQAEYRREAVRPPTPLASGTVENRQRISLSEIKKENEGRIRNAETDLENAEESL